MPPHFSAKGAFFLLAFCLSRVVVAQETAALSSTGSLDSVLVSARTSDDTDATSLAFATWSGLTGNAVYFTFTPEKNTTGYALPLDQLVIAGIEQYLDDRVHFTRDGVHTDLDAAKLGMGIDRMIGAASAHFTVPQARLSQPTLEQLGRVCRIDWSQANFGIDGGEDQEKYLAIYYYVRAQRQELERQVRNDLLDLAGTDILAGQRGSVAAGMNDAVPTLCNTVFDDQNYMCALDLKADTVHGADVRLTDAMLSGIAARAEADAAKQQGPPVKIRKRDRWLKAELDAINERIDRIDQRKELWNMRDRIDDLEGRMDDIGMQVQEIRDGQKAPEVPDLPVSDPNVLSGRDITFNFVKNSSTLSSEQRALLAEVGRSMAKGQRSRVLITGYADSTGDPKVNMVISEARAKAVRDFLLGMGIGGERLLLNYFGDSRSGGTGPGERRVELQWLK
ncbi:MAG: OmpA family protein [Flavobacteriales bacterium]|nr:OmpA family protein [Flavobacteriales bacterium]